MKEFQIKISGDSADVNRSLTQVIENLNKIGAGAGLEGFAGKAASFLANPLTAVAAALGTIVTLLKQTVSNAREVMDIATRANLSPRQAQAIQSGAEATGISGEEVAQMMSRLRRAQGAAIAAPEGQTANALKMLGFTMQEITSSPSFELFLKFLDRLKEGRLSAEQTAAGMRVFRGNLGSLQVAARRGLSENIRDDLGSALSGTDVQIAIADRWDRDSKKLWAKTKDFVLKIGYGVVDAADRALDVAARAILISRFPKGAARNAAAQILGKDLELRLNNPELRLPEGVKPSAAQEAEILKMSQDEAKRAKERADNLKALEVQAQQMEDANKNFQKISPDKFARMGLFLTGGTEKLTSELVGLNRQSLSELRAIKTKIEALKHNEIGEESFY